jgi:hypothetical protein
MHFSSPPRVLHVPIISSTYFLLSLNENGHPVKILAHSMLSSKKVSWGQSEWCIELSTCYDKLRGTLYRKLRIYEGVSKSFRTGRLEQELQMVELSATRNSCIGILRVSLVSFVAITLYVASQRVISKVSVYFVIDSIRNLLDIPLVCGP